MKYFVTIYIDPLFDFEGFTHAFLGLTKGKSPDELDKQGDIEMEKIWNKLKTKIINSIYRREYIALVISLVSVCFFITLSLFQESNHIKDSGVIFATFIVPNLALFYSMNFMRIFLVSFIVALVLCVPFAGIMNIINLASHNALFSTLGFGKEFSYVLIPFLLVQPVYCLVSKHCTFIHYVLFLPYNATPILIFCGLMYATK